MFNFTFASSDDTYFLNSEINIPNCPTELGAGSASLDEQAMLDIQTLDANNALLSLDIVSPSTSFRSAGRSPVIISTESLGSVKPNVNGTESSYKNAHNTTWYYVKVMTCAFVVAQIGNGATYLVNMLIGYTSYSSISVTLNILITGISSIICAGVVFAFYNKIIDKKNKVLLKMNDKKKHLEQDKLILRERLHVNNMLMQQKTELCSYISHEVRNPLQGILFELYTLQDNVNDLMQLATNPTIPDGIVEQHTVAEKYILEENDSSKKHDIVKKPLLENQAAIEEHIAQITESLDTALLCTKQIEIVVDGILKLQKLEATMDLAQQAPEQVFTLTQLVNVVFSPIKARARNKHLQLVCLSNINFNSAFKGDFEKVREITTNFLTNAIKFTARGFIKLIIRQEQQISDDVLQLHFTVQDSGMGMEPEQTKRIFKPYCQAEVDTEHKFGGTGLGLNIAYVLANKLNQNNGVANIIGVYSAGTDQGSNFWFRTQLKTANGCDNLCLLKPITTIVTKNKQHEINSFSEQNLHILVVEDSHINQKIMKSLLNKLGCKVAIANTGSEALELVKNMSNTSPYNFIFMDLILPDQDGRGVTSTLRNQLNFQFPIIACTGNGTDQDINECLAVGMNDILLKPVSQQKLAFILNKFFTSGENREITNTSFHSLDLLNQPLSLNRNDTCLPADLMSCNPASCNSVNVSRNQFHSLFPTSESFLSSISKGLESSGDTLEMLSDNKCKARIT